MKQLNKSLCNFIATFELEHPTKGICFDAKLYVYTAKIKIEAESEIHIVTIDRKKLDVLYILDPLINVEGLPDMFLINDFEVSFSKEYGLKLKGMSSTLGAYSLIIQPTGKYCIEPTYEEINAKTYN